MSLSIGSLFSGIGGLELGLEWSGLGHTVWQVEQNPFCRAVLAKHWPGAERFDDVCTVGKANLAPVDLICGGFPCQDVSAAGKGAGLSGARSGLWSEFRRVVDELQPSWVVVENVASGASRWLDAVRESLGELGYASLPIPLRASDVGALHRRARIFVVAAHAGKVGHEAGIREPVANSAGRADADGSDRRDAADADSQPLRLDQQRHAQGREAGSVRDQRDPLAGFPGWRDPEPNVVRVVHGVRDGLDSRRRGALGNAVVPQCAEVAGWVIRELMGDIE